MAVRSSKKYTIAKLISFVIAAQILNVSIDGPALQSSSDFAGGRSFNYINSYVEYFSEVILKYENAIPETPNHQQKDLLQHKSMQVIFTMQNENIIPAVQPGAVTKSYVSYPNRFAYQHISEIIPPPPWMV